MQYPLNLASKALIWGAGAKNKRVADIIIRIWLGDQSFTERTVNIGTPIRAGNETPWNFNEPVCFGTGPVQDATTPFSCSRKVSIHRVTGLLQVMHQCIVIRRLAEWPQCYVGSPRSNTISRVLPWLCHGNGVYFRVPEGRRAKYRNQKVNTKKKNLNRAEIPNPRPTAGNPPTQRQIP